MDLKGNETISTGLSEQGISAKVFPADLEKDENTRFVTIETHESVRPEKVLNALSRLGLMHSGESTNYYTEVMSDDPQLHVLGAQPGSITFEDRNNY